MRNAHQKSPHHLHRSLVVPQCPSRTSSNCGSNWPWPQLACECKTKNNCPVYGKRRNDVIAPQFHCQKSVSIPLKFTRINNASGLRFSSHFYCCRNADCPGAPWHIASRAIDLRAASSCERAFRIALHRGIKVRHAQCIQTAIDSIRKVIFVQKNDP